jgi:hypothetical protein
MRAELARMTRHVLSALGQDATLRGSVACRVNIEHGVQIVGTDDNVTASRSIATIASSVEPREGDTLTHPDGTFRLDSLFADNGYTKRYLLIAL